MLWVYYFQKFIFHFQKSAIVYVYFKHAVLHSLTIILTLFGHFSKSCFALVSDGKEPLNSQELFYDLAYERASKAEVEDK